MAQHLINRNQFEHFLWNEATYNWLVDGCQERKLIIESSSAIPIQIVFLGPENDTIEKVQQVLLRNENGGNGGVPWDPSQLAGSHDSTVKMMERNVNILPEQQSVTIHRYSNNPPIGISYGIYDYLFIDGFPQPECGCEVHAPSYTNYGGPPIGGYIVLVARNEERTTINRCLGLDQYGRINPLSLSSSRDNNTTTTTTTNNNNNNNRELSKTDSSSRANMSHPDLPRELQSEIMQFLYHPPFDVKFRVLENVGNVYFDDDNDDDDDDGMNTDMINENVYIEDDMSIDDILGFYQTGETFTSDHDNDSDNIYNGDDSE